MPDDFFYRPLDNLNFNPSAVDVKPLIQLAQAGQKPATKQPASTNPQGGVDTAAVQNIGRSFGRTLQDLMNAYRQQAERYGAGQPQQGVAGQPGPIATPPMPQQQPVGPPMKIVPQGYGYQ